MLFCSWKKNFCCGWNSSFASSWDKVTKRPMVTFLTAIVLVHSFFSSINGSEDPLLRFDQVKIFIVLHKCPSLCFATISVDCYRTTTPAEITLTPLENLLSSIGVNLKTYLFMWRSPVKLFGLAEFCGKGKAIPRKHVTIFDWCAFCVPTVRVIKKSWTLFTRYLISNFESSPIKTYRLLEMVNSRWQNSLPCIIGALKLSIFVACETGFIHSEYVKGEGSMRLVQRRKGLLTNLNSQSWNGVQTYIWRPICWLIALA